MAYATNSDTLRQHRDRLLEIALEHAARGGLGTVKRASLAAEANVSTGLVSAVMGDRATMLDLVLQASRQRGLNLKYA